MEADLVPYRNDLYSQDYRSIHRVRASLLGLVPGSTPTAAQINASPRFSLQSATSEREAPDIVTSHWMPILAADGCLADCPPGKFEARDSWVPIYMPNKLREDLPAALSAYGSISKPPHLMAVVPPNLPLGTNKEFLLTSFHNRECLRRQSLTINGKRRQISFCPYCGVLNENSDTGLNHMRKHLDLMLVCGGCQTKSFPLGQALHKHMKDNCPAVLAILGKT